MGNHELCGWGHEGMARKVKRLLLASAKGGVGKTTCSRSLAVAAASAGLSVAVVDLDQQRSLQKWWERRPEAAPAMDCFGATMEDVEAVLKEADAGHDLVVIDTPPAVEFFPEQIKRLIHAADFILVPTGTSVDDTDSTIEFMSVVAGLRKPSAYLLCKVNRRAGSFNKAKQRLVESGRTICPFEIPTYEDFATVAELGVGITELKGAKGAEEMTGVWTYVKKELGL